MSIGLSRRVSLTLALPLYQVREHEHFDEVGTPEEHFTGTDGSTGFGDGRLLGRYALVVAPKDLLVVGAGIQLPTGAFKLRDGEGEINEPSLQPGSGATDLLGTIYYAHQWVPRRWEYLLSGSYQRRGENSLDYRFGNQTLANAGIRFSTTSRLLLSLQANAQVTPHDAYRDRIVSGTGFRQVSLTPGVTLFNASGIGLYVHLAVPVYQKVNEAQLASRTGLALGLTGTF